VSKVKLLALGVLMASSVSLAHAEGPWSVGAGALVTPDPYKGHQDRLYPVPIVGYEGEDFYVRSLNAGYYLWNDKTDKLAVTAYYSPLRYRPKDSNNDDLAIHLSVIKRRWHFQNLPSDRATFQRDSKNSSIECY